MGCNKPAPTELIQDSQSNEDSYEVEVVSKNPSDDSYSNGYDSTGVVDSVISHATFIYAAGVKVTYGSLKLENSIAEAIFFNTDNPIYFNGRIIGYSTFTPGVVRFNNHRARLEKLKVNLKGMGRDTSIGERYILFRGKSLVDPFQFEYNSKIDFRLSPFNGSTVDFQIPTPPELTGSLKLVGKKGDDNFKLTAEWDNPTNKKIDIVLGVVSSLNKVIPIYRLKTKDDGRFQIPANLINQIPSDKFQKIAVTLIRKYERYERDGSDTKKDIHLLTQSAHTIIISSP